MKSVDRYIDAVRTLPRLTAEEEHTVAVRAAGGDAGARRRLVEANLHHVVAVALKLRRYRLGLEDLISEGNVGLTIAATKFDPSKGTRFITYASYWVRAQMLEAVVRSEGMTASGGPFKTKLFFRLRRERAKVASQTEDREKQLALLEARLGHPRQRIARWLDQLDAHDVALDAPRTTGKPLHELLEQPDPSPEEVTLRRETVRRVRERLARVNNLSEREWEIVRAHDMDDEKTTFAELGRRLGISRERVRQLHQRATQRVERALRGV